MQIFLLNDLHPVYPRIALLPLHPGHSPVVHTPSENTVDPDPSPHSASALGNGTLERFATIPLEKMFSKALIKDQIIETKLCAKGGTKNTNSKCWRPCSSSCCSWKSRWKCIIQLEQAARQVTLYMLYGFIFLDKQIIWSITISNREEDASLWDLLLILARAWKSHGTLLVFAFWGQRIQKGKLFV